jgi:hypothetical protein
MQPLDDESTTVFADMERQHHEFLRRIALAQVTDILGVVSAFGAGGSQGRSDEKWNLVFFFDGWRQGSGPVQTTELRVEMPVSESELSSYLARVKPYDMLLIKGQMADHPAGRKQALAREIVFDVSDVELATRAQELQKPVTVENPRFGVFTLNRSVNWFCGASLWAGKRIELNLSMENSDSVEELFAVATQIWDSEEEWNDKIVEYAVKSLLPLKNDVWLEEDEMELNADQFGERMSLNSITIYPDGAFEFWYDDGGMFLGHLIMVRGSLAGGLDDAGIHG